ncbi:MAG: type 4a pilus biogenesis protein PilO [Sulfurifustis sp.]
MTVSRVLESVRYALRARSARIGAAMDALLAVIFLAVLFVQWWPSANAQRAVQRQLDEERRAVTAAMQANDVANAYAAAARAVATIEGKLDTPVKQAQLVQSLAALAHRHGVRIVSESYEEGRPQAAYAPLFVQAALTGSYASVRSFLGDVGSLPVWAEIEETRLERLREPAGQIKAQVRLRLVRRTTRGSGA